MGIAVSAAGPLSNLVLAFVMLFLLYTLINTGAFDFMSAGWYSAVFRLLQLCVHLNLLLFVFNLIPLPPLDGYRIIEDLAPESIREQLQRIEPYSVFLFLLMVFIPPLYRVTIGPILSLTAILYKWMNGLMVAVFI